MNKRCNGSTRGKRASNGEMCCCAVHAEPRTRAAYYAAKVRSAVSRQHTARSVHEGEERSRPRRTNRRTTMSGKLFRQRQEGHVRALLGNVCAVAHRRVPFCPPGNAQHRHEGQRVRTVPGRRCRAVYAHGAFSRVRRAQPQKRRNGLPRMVESKLDRQRWVARWW